MTAPTGHAQYQVPEPRPTNGGECPGCGRVMSVREGVEQGVCNDCLGGAL